MARQQSDAGRSGRIASCGMVVLTGNQPWAELLKGIENQGLTKELLFLRFWCLRWGSNPHGGIPHWILRAIMPKTVTPRYQA